MNNNLLALKSEMTSELVNNILPYWSGRMLDSLHGGFYGRVNGNEDVISDAPKGGILNARILWTFSAAYNLLKNPSYLQMATRAKDFILKHFFDHENGGTYWSITFDGKPLDTKKQIYSQAFFIYALTEYYKATGDMECLEKAIYLFRLIEKHSFDSLENGYFEAYSNDWILLDDLRLSDKDANEKKTMNTHLHILEAYANLYRVWKDELLTDQLKNLIDIFLEKITDSNTFHLNLFFDEQWNCKSNIVSYGHDIEASWLIYEAAQVLGDYDVLTRVHTTCIQIAEAARDGLQPDGSMVNETDNDTGHTDMDRHWWPQAETIVGYFNAWEISHHGDYLNFALNNWNFIKNNLIDNNGGEWFWSVKEDGTINVIDDKAGFWKCPYHNSRACLEIIHRIQ